MYGVNMDAFLCLGDDIKWPETIPQAVSDKVIEKIADIDRTLFTKKGNCISTSSCSVITRAA